ncbi:hypothetical protein BRC65_09160 [Halobacteriales archaeon QH_2_65_14]|nr:MAG: hypothetical protein BRC65_09160 [Halobacteriales archaeon QH_2_65_14]
MVDALLVGGVVLTVWAVGLVHQLGHYFAGRRIVGIPAAELTLVSPLVPRYVALRDDDEGVPPTEFERYRDVYARHDPEFEHLERFVAGGEIVQTFLLVPAAIAIALNGFEVVAALVLVASIGATLVAVGYDAVLTHLSETPSGDYSALWVVSRRIPVLLLVGFLFVHLGAFYFVA